MPVTKTATDPTPFRNPISQALEMHRSVALPFVLGEDVDAALKSAVRAVIPGRQQKKNLTPIMDAARKAFVRTLRRRAKSA